MGKKTKIGKQRKDKFYFLAKEAGFRSRAAFKLLQLNKRFEFLQRCRALVDLCAAPGGWLQVAEQQMPVSSLRIGVDLVPMKPIKNCITLQGDIIEEKLGTWEADCVLHDGAPNIGTNWAHDAFQQNCLTLSALRLATQVLRKGGFFVTKIFRSADSQCLIGVFEKLFRKPDKVPSELLDSKKVFSDQTDGGGDESEKNLQRLLLHPGRKERKAKALGYGNDALLGQHSGLGATEFVTSKNALQLLSRASELVLDSERVLNSEHTTNEIKECLKDIKVCGPAELRSILKWRKKLVDEQKKEEKASKESVKSAEEMVEGDTGEELEENAEFKELEEIDELIRTAKAEEKATLKKRKRKLLKAKRNLEERKKLKMVHEGDEPTMGEDLELFSLKTVKRLAERAAKAVKGIKEEEEKESNDEEDDEEEKDGEKATTKMTKMEKEFDDGLNEAIEEEEEKDEHKLGTKSAKKPKLTPEQLAMGEEMIYSKKRAQDLEDWAWNRYTSNDEALPEWFVSDEKRHCQLEPPVDKERVDFYAKREQRELNTRPIKKVAEAKARKRQRRIRRMEKAKKKAEGIVDNEQMEHGEKVRELRRLYKKAGSNEKRKVTYQVVTKGKRGSMSRPDGHYRLVDKRMKKDMRKQSKTGTKRTNKANTNTFGRKGKMREKSQNPKERMNSERKDGPKQKRKNGKNGGTRRMGGEKRKRGKPNGTRMGGERKRKR
ncbi:hypothetical protein niasHS_003781 [Heterodera schachtii]|uniref:rRNA methyltransferase n=2 Tax=Heterodera TaxID=34509 RepID=A0ABD2K6G2_HETSC